MIQQLEPGGTYGIIGPADRAQGNVAECVATGRWVAIRFLGWEQVEKGENKTLARCQTLLTGRILDLLPELIQFPAVPRCVDGQPCWRALGYAPPIEHD